jgi:ankyrin repeat protein
MHSIARSLLPLMLLVTFTNHLNGMHEINLRKICKAVPEVRDLIIYDSLVYAFSKKDNPHNIGRTLNAMRCVNKKLNGIIHKQDLTQAIIDRVSRRRNQDYWTLNMKTAEMNNYLQKSTVLYKNIGRMKAKKIDSLLLEGADINYWPKKNRPLLFRALNNYDATKKLLDRGVNPNMVYHKKTALQHMVEKGKLAMVKLILSYNPQNKCLPLAVFYQNSPIIKCILECKDIPQDELNESLIISVQKNDSVTVQALVNAGAEFEAYFNNLKNKFLVMTDADQKTI